jgi:WD40 repeat protein
MSRISLLFSWVVANFPLRGKGIALFCAVTLSIGVALFSGGLRRDEKFPKPKNILRGHEYIIRSLAFSPDGSTLASGGGPYMGAGELICWSVATGEPEWRNASVEKDSSQNRESATNTLGKLIPNLVQIRSLAFSHDGQTLATGGYDGTVHLWDSRLGHLKGNLKGHGDLVCAVAFSPDDRTIVSGSGEDSVRLWDVEAGKEVVVLTHLTDWAGALTYSKAGPVLATRAASEPDVKVWSWDDQGNGPSRIPAVAVISGPKSAIACMAFSPDANLLAAGSMDGGLMVWERTRREIRNRFQMGHLPIATVAFSPDGKTLGAGSLDGLVSLWDLSSNQQVIPVMEHRDIITALAFSPDGKLIATAGRDKGLILWEIGTPANSRRQIR